MPRKWTIDMLDKEELVALINAMFKNEIPDVVIQGARYVNINRKLRTISSSLGDKTKKIKTLRGKKREDLAAKATSQYRLFNKLVKEREELLIFLAGTEFDPLRDGKSTGKGSI